MTNAQIIISTTSFGLVLGALNIVGASAYDFSQTRRKKLQKAQGKAKKRQTRPLVSIIITTHNSEAEIERCLTSITKSSYRKYEVIVVDNASTDNTKKIIADFIKSHPKKQIRLVAKRKVENSWMIRANAFKSYAKGSVILSLDAGAALEKEVIKNAVGYFENDSKVSLISFNERIESNYTLSGLLQEYEKSIVSQWKKSLSICGVKYINNGSSFMYSRKTFSQMFKYKNLADESIARRLIATRYKNRKMHAKYASDAVINCEGPSSKLELFRDKYTKKVNALKYLFRYQNLFAENQNTPKFFMRLSLLVVVLKHLALLAVPVIVTYFIYLAASFRTPLLLAFSWAAFSVFLFITVWGDETIKFFKKARMSGVIPITYGLFYIVLFFQLAAWLDLLALALKAVGKKIFYVSWSVPRRLLAIDVV